MALSGWNADQKLKLTIDGSKIEENLTDFPVNITLSSGTGITGFDTTDVFDKLTPAITSGTSFLFNAFMAEPGYSHDVVVVNTPEIRPDAPTGMLGSMYFDGVNEHLYASGSSDFNFSGEFTIDFWLKSSDTGDKLIMDKRGGSWNAGDCGINFGNMGTGIISFNFNDGSTVKVIATTNIADGFWHHVAVTRDSSSDIRVFIDGIVEDTVNNSQSFSNVETLYIGCYTGSAGFFNGSLSEFRILNGIASWTSNFTPSSSPHTYDSYTKLLLHFDSDRSLYEHNIVFNGNVQLINRSPFNTSGSVYFNGTSSFLSLANNTAWDFGSGDLTIGLWARFSSFNTTDGFDTLVWRGTNSIISFQLDYKNSTNELRFIVYVSGVASMGNSIVKSWTPATNTWYHIEVVRTGNVLKFFINGTQQGTDAPITNAIDSVSQSLVIGMRPTTNDREFNGYIADLEILKGTAKHTSNFTKPAGPAGSSWENRDKLVVTDSNDNKLYTEVAYWDAINREASLWTRVPTISSGTYKQLILYYDATTSGSDTRTLAEANDDFTGTNGDSIDKNKWRLNRTDWPDIQNNKMHSLVTSASAHREVQTLYSFEGDFDFQVDFDLVQYPATNDWFVGLMARDSSYTGSGNIQFYITREYYNGRSGHAYFSAWYTPSYNHNATTGTSDISGKFRITRSGSSWSVYYWNGSSWTQHGSSRTINANPVHIVLQTSTYTGLPTVESNFDNLIINSADSITGFTGDTATEPAQNVWDSNFVGVWHMDTTPTSSVLDSSMYGNNGTSAGTMTDTDLVAGKVGNAMEFDGSDDGIVFANSASVTTTVFTIEGVIKPTNVSSTFGILQHVAYSGPSDNGGYSLYGAIDTPGEYHLICYNNGETEVTYVDTETNAWKHIVGTYDNTNLKIYIDGDLKNTNPAGASKVRTTQAYEGYISNPGISLPGAGDEFRISNVARSDGWTKATYYSNFNNLISFTDQFGYANFFFTSATPASGTVYGTTRPLYITVTVSGSEPSYIFDAEFYDGGDAQIGTTVYGEASGNQITRTLSTPSGTSYSWYVTATASGFSDTSETYTFDNRFLCAGYTMVNGTRTSGIPVRLYRREDGSLQGETTSAGVSGTFDIETLYNEEHYAVALHPDGAINALVYDHIIP